MHLSCYTLPRYNGTQLDIRSHELHRRNVRATARYNNLASTGSGDATDDSYDNSVYTSIIMMVSPTEIQCMPATDKLNTI